MIEQPGKKKMLLFSGSSNEELASNVAANLGTEVSTVESKEFASGEIYIRLNESVRVQIVLFYRVTLAISIKQLWNN